MLDVLALANHEGCYDAADVVQVWLQPGQMSVLDKLYQDLRVLELQCEAQQAFIKVARDVRGSPELDDALDVLEGNEPMLGGRVTRLLDANCELREALAKKEAECASLRMGVEIGGLTLTPTEAHAAVTQAVADVPTLVQRTIEREVRKSLRQALIKMLSADDGEA
jgi:hypothetical protein